MLKPELITAIAIKSGYTKKSIKEILNTLDEVVTETLESGEDVNLLNLGIFKIKDKAPRKGYDISTGKAIDIPARKAVNFKESHKLKKIGK